MADDSPLVRERLAELISATPGVELVGQAEKENSKWPKLTNKN
jgi:DNA-binding NarL/FixJ family response regulator